MVPGKTVSVGFTRTICVVQPPPSAKWGNTIAPVAAAERRSVTGNVVIRNSPRSLVNPRSAITAMGMDELKVKAPLREEGPLKGGSLRNFAICRLAGIVVPMEKLLFA